MAFHFISLGRCNLLSLLVTFLLCLFTIKVLAQNAPPDVTGVKTDEVTEGSFTVSWTPVDNVTEYNVVVRSAGGTITNNNINEPKYTESGIPPGTIYSITIYSINENGTSSIQGTTYYVTTLPNSVDNFHVTAVKTNEMNLSWTIPADGNASYYYYNITIQPGDTKTSHSNFYLVSGLEPGSTYTFTIYTVTGNGVISKQSQTTTNTTLPSPVTGLDVTSVSQNSVNLSWPFSTDPNSKSYTYTVDGGGGHVKMDIQENYTEIQNLSPGTDYNFTVFAVTGNKVKGGPSNVANATTLPSPVQGLEVISASDNSVTLNWTLSSDPNKNSYTYTVDDGDNHKETGIRANNVTIRSLSPGTDYNFTVYAVTNNGKYSISSNVVNATTLPSPVQNLEVISVSDNSVTLNWTLSSDPNTNSYTYTVDGGGNHKQTNITANIVTIGSLSPGTDYNFTVFAVTKNGKSGISSDVVNATTMPSPVQGLTVISASDNSVTLNWTLSSDPNKNSYTYTVDDGDNHKQTNITTNDVTIGSLSPGTDYNFTVYAVTKNGKYSRTSNVANVTTLPTPVMGLNVSFVSNDSVILTWTFSTDPNYDSYTYTVSDGGAHEDPFIKSNTTKVMNLDAGTNYNFTVYAVTRNGKYSKASNVVNVTTQPNIVQVVKEVNVSETTVTLQWNFSNDKNHNTYTYTVECQGINFLKKSNLKNNSVEFEDLFPGVNYNLTVFAVTENGIYSQPSEVVHATTQPTAPKYVQGNAVNISEIYIVWTAPEDINVKSYDYRVTWQDMLTKAINTETTKETHFRINQLLPGHVYKIDVRSVIQNTASISEGTYVVTKPLSIENLKISTINNTSVTLIWDETTDPNNVKTGYRITVDIDKNQILQDTTPKYQYVVNDLEPGSIYNISVESYSSYEVNANGIRMVRATNPIITYSEPRLINVETVPDPVKNLKCSKVSAYQIKVDFECPAGYFSMFDVLVNNASREQVTTCPKDVLISNLQPTAKYKISVMTVAFQKRIVTGIIICEPDNTGVIVGSIFGVLLFLLIIAVIAFFVLRSRRKKGQDKDISFKQRRFHTISRDKFGRHYEDNHANSDFGFADEYQELSSVGTVQSKKAAELPENKPKNRFTNVLPYDHSRVKLSTANGISTSDYINANYIPGYNSTKEFIASQGPLPNTTADFWRMVWEHQVNTIVMLTNCMESGRIKCEHYWPLDYTPCTYGDITVTVTSETILSEWTIRDFSIKHAYEPGVKYVRHFHFTAWPDHGVPDSTSSLIKFRNLVREHVDQRRSSGPTIVHCSAGVGRTGTLIALDYLMLQMEKEQRIGVYGFVEKMRINRNLMVQTEAQYIFLNKCMLDLIDQPMEDHIYENHTANELVYENVNAIRQHQRENA
ncbi:hypothetical protein GDO81_013859 [Engystomops pustulosus]|uniref:protein-tyrosine-phosphatase n=1 Tax=Engystomops pustulosus TaxID=76066 RepID=A0AAV7B620_ENGPU|nr:hypothetical protein GDO81_013859 [Engystomops pustulosus]